MKKSVIASVLFLAFAVTAFAAPVDTQYQDMMKKAVAANGALTKAVMGADWSAAATAATGVQEGFKQIEDYWKKKGGADDAVMFSVSIETAAKEVHDAAAAGNAEAATAAQKKIGANCGGCHMAHRVKTDSGYDIK